VSFRDGSTLVGGLREAREAVSTATEHSYFVTDVRRVATRVRAARDGPTVLGALDGPGLTLDRWIRSSWLYRWLTAEPEPDVIVIDLRETYTVGPVLAALDRAVERAAPRWRDSAPDRTLAWASTTVTNAPVGVASWIAILALVGSLLTSIVSGRTPPGALLVVLGLALLGTRERRSAAELRGSRAGRAIAALLVPPDLSEERETADDDRRRD